MKIYGLYQKRLGSTDKGEKIICRLELIIGTECDILLGVKLLTTWKLNIMLETD